jgi:hypothetical protein
MPWGADFKGLAVKVLTIDFTVHGACAVTLFLCIGYVCIFRACDTLELIKDEAVRNRYRAAYKWLGRAMIVFPLVIFVLFSVLHIRNRGTFFIEAVGIWVFAAYWLVKNSEISRTDADRLALCGALHGDDGGGSGPFRRVRIRRSPDDSTPTGAALS